MSNDDLLLRQLGIDPDDAGKPAPYQVAPGKQTLTQRLPGYRRADPEAGASTDRGAEPARAAARPEGLDDPFGIHLGNVMRKETGVEGFNPDAADRIAEARASTGAPLPEALRSKFESSLSADLGAVRIHDGGTAAAAADSISARAYTLGQDIHFGAGELDPGSAAGERLLAHEVAHTVQQAGGALRTQAKLEVSTPGDAAERQADAAADAMVRGERAEVGPMGHGQIARDPKPGAAAPGAAPAAAAPAGGLDASMFTVTGGEPKFAGTVTAEKSDGKVRLTSPPISFAADVTLKTPLGDGERIDVGPVQTMLSSSRIGVYREGGKKDGAIVAEQHTDLGEMRDVTGEIGKNGQLDQSTMPPFYSNPSALNASTSSATIQYMDKPRANFPSTVGKGALTETKGQDSFVTSVTAKRDAALVHLKTFKWQLPWGLQLDDGVIQNDAKGKSTAGAISEQAAAPGDGIAHNDSNVPILAAAGATHMDFASQDAANAASVPELMKYLPSSTPAARGFIVEALKRKNPTFHITLTVDKKNSSWGKDSIEMRMKGQTQVSRPRVSAGDGGKVAVMVQLNEVFGNIGAINGGTVLTIEAQDESLIDGKTHRVDWPWPFEALDGKMPGSDGTYSIVAAMH